MSSPKSSKASVSLSPATTSRANSASNTPTQSIKAQGSDGSKTPSKGPSKTGSEVSAKSAAAASAVSSKTGGSVFSFEKTIEDPYFENCEKPDFIYGGPFINVRKPEPFLDTSTPINIQLQGTFKKSFAYYSLKERLPVILTKIIDQVSRTRSDADSKNYIKYVSKLKNDLVTNKKYDLLTEDSDDARKWNECIEACDQPHYFTNNWCFTECYVYRRLREGCELCKMKDFDPFEKQKQDSFKNNLEPMCIVAERMQDMLEPSEKDKRKADFVALLKICLWSNKCDLCLTLGEPVAMPAPAPPAPPAPPGGKGAPPPPPPPTPAKPKSPDISKSGSDATKSVTILEKKPPPVAIDPFQLIVEYKDKLLVDDTNKIADQIVAKAEKMAGIIDSVTTFKCKCSCHRLAKVQKTRICMDEEQLEAARVAAALAAENKGKGKGKGKPPPPPPPPPPAELEEGEEPPPPPIPCPAKVTVPSAVQFDIVCDNAGYELFTDLCLAHFLVSQKIVQKVRFHVKAIPWFVSDVTPKDFKYVVESCVSASYSRTVPPPEPKPVAEGEEAPEPEPPRDIGSAALRALGEDWRDYLQDGTFVIMSEDYWTMPHVYRDLKKYDYWLYRKLQMACGILFKGDLNYRKLVGERNCSPVAGFEASLQGFIPAPIIALRTVKSDLICGLPRGKFDAISKLDPLWMRKGDYGVIQFCGKAEALKVADRPCAFYCEECMGLGCPAEGAFW